MTRSISQHAPPTAAGAVPSGTTAPPPSFVHPTPEDRHAAVCAGAIKYLPDLRVFARALAGSSHEADDLVQNAILRALGAAEQFTPGTNFRAWSFTILRNVFYNQWRSRAARPIMIDDCPAGVPATAPTQQASLEFCDFRRAFAELGANQREALLLVGASGLSYAEAAVVCNCAPGTMKSRVSRGRATLRGMMDGGAMKLRRRDATPVSDLDLALALEAAMADAALRAGRVAQPQPTLRDGADETAAPAYHLAAAWGA
jgi:RNA polymerase sigma-70 factor (ECF subfamily)